MKTNTDTLQTSIYRVTICTVGLLLIPLFGTMFVEGWDWGIEDFTLMGILLFVVGLALDFAIRTCTDPIDRIMACGAIIAVFFAIWAELAVDAISQLVAFIF